MIWNRLEDRPAPVGVALLVTTHNKLLNRYEVKFAVYQKDMTTGNWGFNSGDGFLSSQYNEVVAWIEVPEPYKENEQ